jgi:histidinol-phosphate/aromatic aminotransferase/cobyric acid decarboxylase-like protein/GNAT superfamily N-acetyltransferase
VTVDSLIGIFPLKTQIAIATEVERPTIYGWRHAVYAAEIGQHPLNSAGELRDTLDPINEYIVATRGGEVVGFVSITPPGAGTYSFDKYFPRCDLPFPIDPSLYEVRLLTVPAHRRGQDIASLLIYAAYRSIESRGGTRIVAIGRREVLPLYRKIGLEPHGLRTQAGAVTYELMSATIRDLRRRVAGFARLLARLERNVDWRLPLPFRGPMRCHHGGAFFEAIGETFQTLRRSLRVVNADVLDAWFSPAPGALQALQEYLPWLIRTSPPQDGIGLVRTIAQVRGIPAGSLAVGAGSSSLIYLAFRHWLGMESRVLLPDPTYGEYAHVLERVIGCRVDRFPLSRAEGFRLDLDVLLRRLRQDRYDLAILVNPNNPTGRLIPRAELGPFLAQVPWRTRLWIDEAYTDYSGGQESVEVTASQSRNIVVCKSLSKVYALSGARAAYLCGPFGLMEEIRNLTPPWAISLPAQVAAVAALHDPDYYALRYQETAALRRTLGSDLTRALPSAEILVGAANSLLCFLSPQRPTAAVVCERCRGHDVFLRDAGTISLSLGRHTVRIAVKDAADNARIVAALAAEAS